MGGACVKPVGFDDTLEDVPGEERVWFTSKPGETTEWKTRKGTLVDGNIACKSNDMVLKIYSVFLSVLVALAIAGLVGGRIDWTSAVLVSIVGISACTASVFSGLPRDLLATHIYDEK